MTSVYWKGHGYWETGTGWFDIMYQTEIKQYLEKVQALDENMHTASDNVRRLTQFYDELKSQIGTKRLEEFVEHTEEYTNDKDFQKKDNLKDQSFDHYMAYLPLYNSDQAKYWTLLSGLRSQYSLENDQSPKSVNSATDILSNHRHDNQNKQWESSEYTERLENIIDKDEKNTAT